MPEETSQRPVTTFHLFLSLPLELRRHIWNLALPGPRIIYVQRYIFSDIDFNTVWHCHAYHRPNPPLPPEPTYFGSPSPNTSIVSLLNACKDSAAAVRSHYTLILPRTSTWFSFDKDFLFLDFGTRGNCVPYEAKHFTPSFPEEDPHWAILFGYPQRYPDIDLPNQVKNLILYTRWRYDDLARCLMENLKTFVKVEVCVLADMLFTRDEETEDLTWLRGELDDDLKTGEGPQYHPELLEWDDPNDGPQTLLWRDWAEYKLTSASIEGCRREWYHHSSLSHRREIPTIIRKSVTSSNLKKGLLALLGSEDKFWEIQELDMGFIKGEHKYFGPLSREKQLEYIELVLGRLELEQEYDEQGIEVKGAAADEVYLLLEARDRLLVEPIMDELILREASASSSNVILQIDFRIKNSHTEHPQTTNTT